jgi:glycosyltransferase involved in cell wall biosynthesis
MRLSWYWPYLRPEHLPLVDAMGARVEQLVVHTIAGRIDDGDLDRADARIDPTVPEVGVERERSIAWMKSRATIYASRVRHRSQTTREADLVHIVFVNRFTDWWALERLARHRPLVTTVHDVVPHQTRLPPQVEHRLLDRLYRHAGELIVHHESIRRRLQADFAVPSTRIHEIPHWVLPAPSEHRDRPNSPATVLAFGALRRNKGTEVLLDAISRRPDLDARFVFAGRGVVDIEEQLRAAAERDPRVHVEIGYIDEHRKHELYRQADVVALPYTEFASQSGVLHDAYSHGRPVVVSDVGALGETVRAEATGVVVPPRDPTALIEAITAITADPVAWASAAQASESVRAANDPGATADRLLEVYEAALRR